MVQMVRWSDGQMVQIVRFRYKLEEPEELDELEKPKEFVS